MAEKIRDIAHVSAVELLTPVLEDTVRFFTGQMAMEVVEQRGDSAYLHAWDDYERFTVKITGGNTSGSGRTWLRARSPEALERRAREISSAGPGKAGARTSRGTVPSSTSPTRIHP